MLIHSTLLTSCCRTQGRYLFLYIFIFKFSRCLTSETKPAESALAFFFHFFILHFYGVKSRFFRCEFFVEVCQGFGGRGEGWSHPALLQGSPVDALKERVSPDLRVPLGSTSKTFRGVLGQQIPNYLLCWFLQFLWLKSLRTTI